MGLEPHASFQLVTYYVRVHFACPYCSLMDVQPESWTLSHCGCRKKRVCFSSIMRVILARDHANLLCIFKRLFNVAARRLDNENAKIKHYILRFLHSIHVGISNWSKTNCFGEQLNLVPTM